ncbi:hypothetical protein TW65_04904 [Stemphylium lycopersici]|nr:hypothetical protein TW65_04904 [Stemphylium lycopersici]
MSLSISSLVLDPTPSSVGCLPNSAPTLRNVTGIFDHVCQINYAPDVMDISSCCKDGVEVRVQDNCTQYCEADVDQADEFRQCVVDKLDQDPVTSIAAYCELVNQASPSSTPDSSTTPSPNPTQSGDLPETTEGAASSLGRYSGALAAVAAAVAFRFSSLI